MTVEVAGAPLAREELKCLVEVQVEESTEEADAATLTARVRVDAKGNWSSVLDPLTTPRTKVAVELRRGHTTYRFVGLSTEASWQLDPKGASRLTVKALDRTLEMNIEEKVKSWAGTSDSGIANAILSSYGFQPDVQDTPDSPDPDVHTVLQRATDWSFLRSLAAKWGYAIYLEADNGRVVGRFRPLDPLAEPHADLSFGFGDASRPVSVAAQLVAGRDVKTSRLPPLSDTVVAGEDDGKGGAQGGRSLGGETTILLSPHDLDGEIDPTEATKALARRSAFAVRMNADVETERIGRLVRARRTVRVRGLGGSLSGTYLVDRVRHKITPEMHRQQLTLVRNAFSSSSLGLGL